jgi:hypothetical protein
LPDLVFVVLYLQMPDTTNTATLTRLFKRPDARLGKKWIDSVDDGWTDAALHRVVLAKGTLSASKTKEMYGHYRTKTQMRGLKGPYWHTDAAVALEKETCRLNIPLLDTQNRLNQLRTDKIGGLLVVTKVADMEGKNIPFLTVLAAPSAATFNTMTGDAGVIFDDIWDATVLEAFKPDLVTTTVHCPLMGAQEGFSRCLELKPTVVGILQDAQPFLLPTGELTCDMVIKDNVNYPRTIFLPEVCNLPIGMRWPVDIGFPDFLSSISKQHSEEWERFSRLVSWHLTR